MKSFPNEPRTHGPIFLFKGQLPAIIKFFIVGVGGQVDFIRGAALGTDGQGKPILAMPSTTRRGESK